MTWLWFVNWLMAMVAAFVWWRVARRWRLIAQKWERTAKRWEDNSNYWRRAWCQDAELRREARMREDREKATN